MRRDISLSMLAVLMLLFSVMSAGDIKAETGPELKRFFGEVKSVDCAAGEIRVIETKGEKIFNFGKKVDFEGISGCGDIAAGGRALIRYSEKDGRNIIESIKFRSVREARKTDRATAGESIFMGWVGSVDCEKGALTLQKMDDRSKAETFALDKGTGFAGGITGCGDIKTDSVLAISFAKRGDDKVVKTLKPAIAPAAQGRK